MVKTGSIRQAQLTREWRLLRELQRVPEGRSYVELARALGVAVRTVYRDLETLRGAGFGIVRAQVHAKAVWRLKGTGGPAIAFTPQELTALAMGRRMLLNLPGSPFDRTIQQAYHKIQAACDRDGVKVLEGTDKQLHADLRRARPYTGRQVWFQMLLNALTRRRTVKMRYFTLERDCETNRELDCYGMVFHEGAFYLVGYCHWRRDIRTFLLDRIRSVAETGKTFALPAGFSVREHFRQAWGILKGQALVTIRVRFAREVARVIHEGRWHETQRLEDQADGSVVLTVRVTGWEEMRRWLLGFGAAAEVLEPQDLRRSMADETAKLSVVYRREMKSRAAEKVQHRRRGVAARD